MSTTTPQRRRDVVAQLASAQKSNRGAGGYSRWVNRPAGRQLAAVAYLAGLTPNQVSMLSAAFTFPAIVALAVFKPTLVLAILVVVALLFGYALDSADGQVARLRGGGSPAGEWLDHALDAVKVSAFHMAILISWFRFYRPEHAAALLVPLGFALVSAAFFFTLMLSDMLRRVERLKAGGSSVTTASVNPSEAAPVLRSLVVLPNDYGFICLALLLLAVRPVFIAIYTVLFAFNALFLAVAYLRWFREMNDLGRG